MLNRIILLSFLLGVSSTIATLLYLLFSVGDDPKKRKSKERGTPSNVTQYGELLKHHKQSEQEAG